LICFGSRDRIQQNISKAAWHHAKRYKKGLGTLIIYNPFIIQITWKERKAMNVTIKEKTSFQVMGIKRSYSYQNDENLKGIPMFWKEANQNGEADSLASLNNGELTGLLGVCVDTPKQDKMDYWIGVSTKADANEEYEQLEVPAGKWAIFAVTGPMPRSMQKVWKQIYTEWLPASMYTINGNISLERYQDGDPSSKDYYSEIWIPIREKK